MAGEMTRWGILYCPKAGISNKRKRWEKIQKVLDDRHVEYDFVQSETADSHLLDYCQLSSMISQR